MMWTVHIVAAAVCALMVLATVLAMIETDAWWIRVLDFPRLQIAAVLALALVVYVGSADGYKLLFWALAVPSVTALGWQMFRIAPYTPFWKKQMPWATARDPGRTVSLLLANVLQDNRNFDALKSLIDTMQADIVLLTETDDRWVAGLSAIEQSYPHRLMAPLSNTYGMLLYSRLPLEGGEIRYLVEDHIPSMRTTVRLESGAPFLLWGVHPTPPQPGNDTDERDAELMMVAKEAAAAELPALVAGDLNDVAWSATTSLFQEIGGLLDPRVGRGFFATFNAKWPLMKWPLDHLFASSGWTLLRFKRLGDIGSDHFPIFIELCHRPDLARAGVRHAPAPKAAEEAEEHIRDGLEAAAET